MTYDISAFRQMFPALADGVARFDGPGGSLVPQPVADAVAATMAAGLANRGRLTAAEARTEAVVADARQAIADLLGADPRGAVFGRSMTGLTFEMARTLARSWSPGDEVVVTRLDHDANIRPWVVAAEAVGATVRWADFDPATGELAPESVIDRVGPRTRLVAVTAASNVLGTRPDIPAIAAGARAAGPHDLRVFVDGVHLTPHAPIDVAALGADFYACSPYKFLGPHCGAIVADPALLETLRPDKLMPSTDAVPERFELGTLPFELLAGTTAAVDVLAGIAPDAAADRRSSVLASMAAVEQHEAALLRRLLEGLAQIPGVTRHGDPASRTPTVLLTVDGHEPVEVSRHLAERGVHAPASHFYALEASRHLGMGDAGGVRVGLAAYTDTAEVDRLLEALAAL